MHAGRVTAPQVDLFVMHCWYTAAQSRRRTTMRRNTCLEVCRASLKCDLIRRRALSRPTMTTRLM